MLAGCTEDAKESRRAEASVKGKTLKEKLHAYFDLCHEIGEKPAVVALAWVLQNPIVSAPIIGPRTLEQIVNILRSLEIKLDKAILFKLDEIWPGPGGEAPEAYAW